MKTKKDLLPVHYILRVFNSVNSLCYKYDKLNHRLLCFTRNSNKFWLSVVGLICLTFHLTFQILRFFIISLKHNPIQIRVLDLVWISGYGICTVFYFQLMSRRNQVAAFTNMFVIFEENLGCKHVVIVQVQ